LGLSDSELELEELELLPPDGALGGGSVLPGGLLPLDSVILARGIEPLPDRLLHGGGGRSYSDSNPSMLGIGILPFRRVVPGCSE
jgi:hypothetical protein